jgi:hypothetical protein
MDELLLLSELALDCAELSLDCAEDILLDDWSLELLPPQAPRTLLNTTARPN